MRFSEIVRLKFGTTPDNATKNDIFEMKSESVVYAVNSCAKKAISQAVKKLYICHKNLLMLSIYQHNISLFK